MKKKSFNESGYWDLTSREAGVPLAKLAAISTYFQWKSKYDGMGLKEVKRLWPLPIMGSEARLVVRGNFDINRIVISATVNIHLIGLAINIPYVMALTILLTCGYELPSFTIFSVFALNFVLNQLAIVATPALWYCNYDSIAR